MVNWSVLFNGSDLSGWESTDGSDHDWDVGSSVALDPSDPTRFAVSEGTGLFFNGASGRTADLVSTAVHGDCELHVEFVVPKGSNSGVYVMGLYEVQILDSWGETELKYGTCGGIYCRWIDGKPVGGTPPRVNASRPPGEWQTYDITFRAPRFESGQKVANACLERMVWNDEVVHENVEVEGPTRAALPKEETPTGGLMLQGDHGPVSYRNMRMRLL